jgi:hypothetical protein
VPSESRSTLAISSRCHGLLLLQNLQSPKQGASADSENGGQFATGARDRADQRSSGRSSCTVAKPGPSARKQHYCGPSEPPQEFAKGFRQESSKAFGATLPRSAATADNSDEPVPAGEQTPDVFVGKDRR